MRTQRWLDTRVERARKRVMRDCERQSLSLGSLDAALLEITDDQPTEASAALLEEALDCLPAYAYADLVEQARRCLVHGERRCPSGT